MSLAAILSSRPARAPVSLGHTTLTTSVTMVTDVVSVVCPNETGALAGLLDKIAASDISVEYMYALQHDGQARAIIKPSDLAKCQSVLADL